MLGVIIAATFLLGASVTSALCKNDDSPNMCKCESVPYDISEILNDNSHEFYQDPILNI